MNLSLPLFDPLPSSPAPSPAVAGVGAGQGLPAAAGRADDAGGAGAAAAGAPPGVAGMAGGPVPAKAPRGGVAARALAPPRTQAHTLVPLPAPQLPAQGRTADLFAEAPWPLSPARSAPSAAPAPARPQPAALADPVVPGAAEGAKSAKSAEAADAAEVPPADPVGPADPADPADLVAPVDLHPALWLANQLGGSRQRTTPSGFAALDAQLPGAGWPHGVITELLLPRPGIGELRLLAPALRRLAQGDAGRGGGGGGAVGRAGGPLSPAARPDARAGRSSTVSGGVAREASGAASRTVATNATTNATTNAATGATANVHAKAFKPADDGRCVMLFDPPAQLSAWALAQHGLDTRHWLVVQARAGQSDGGRVPVPHGAHARAARLPRSANGLSPLLPGADLLWALEQTLRSGHVGAVLAWLPLGLRADALRRLQLAAQAHDGPVFVLRDAQVRSQPSAAPLRLLLQPAGADCLSLRVLKRRGPPLADALQLALPPVLSPGQRPPPAPASLAHQAAHQAAAMLRRLGAV